MNEKLHDFLLFNFLAKDRKNAEEIMEAGKGFVVPGIVASDFAELQDAVAKVSELKQAASIVSVGLGESGNPENWEKVLKIAVASDPGHINQPFETASYASGFLLAKGLNQVVNALVVPSGKPGWVKLTSGLEMRVEAFVGLARAMRIRSIKFMPMNGTEHLEELVCLTKAAASAGIRGIEPAGGISADNIRAIVDAVRDSGIEFFMPHVFGSTIDKATGRTMPDEVRKILAAVEE